MRIERNLLIRSQCQMVKLEIINSSEFVLSQETLIHAPVRPQPESVRRAWK